MVLQVLADSGEVVDDVDAERLELARVADARELEQLRRVDRAAAEDHLAGLDPLGPDAARDLDPDRARAVEQDAIHERAAADLEVRSLQHRDAGRRGRRCSRRPRWMLRSKAAKPSWR